jgi:hypothetical protein
MRVRMRPLGPFCVGDTRLIPLQPLMALALEDALFTAPYVRFFIAR